jgi:hypothetical protein
MGGLVVAEIGLVMIVVVVIEVMVMVEIIMVMVEIMEWSVVDQDASRRIWLTLLVNRVQVLVTC